MQIIEFLICIAFILLFLYCIFKYNNRIVTLFSQTCLSIAVYTFGYGLEFLSKNVEDIQFALNIGLARIIH